MWDQVLAEALRDFEVRKGEKFKLVVKKKMVKEKSHGGSAYGGLREEEEAKIR